MSTHQQLLYHIVFSTKNRKRLLNDSIRDDAFAYLAGVCKKLDGFALEVGGYYDHVHLLVRIPARVAVSDYVGKIKANTSKHLNDAKRLGVPFFWQDGYGAFSVSPSNTEAVSRYIRGQMEHHREQTFEDEYLRFLSKHEVEYDKRFVFD